MDAEKGIFADWFESDFISALCVSEISVPNYSA